MSAIPVLIGLAFFISSCKREAVNLEFTNAKGEVAELGNLTFRFNRSLIKDSMINAWDSTDYIDFEPNIPGRFRWESPDQLVFSPSTPLLPATTYKVKLNSELLRYSKYDKITGADDISFSTPPVTLDNVQVMWLSLGDGATSPVAKLDLFFNYRINPKELQKKLTVEIDGTESKYDIETTDANSTISVRLHDIKTQRSEEKEYEAKVVIAKGLVPENGRNASSERISQTLSIPSPYVLTIQNIESEHDGTEGVIRINTNQQISSSELSSHINFNPAVSYTTEISETGFIVRSEKFDIEKSYTITLTKGLRGTIGGTLKEDHTRPLAFGQLEASILFGDAKGIYLSRRGSKNLEVKITNVAKVNVVISKIYENNLIMAGRYHYSPQSDDARYASYDEEMSYDEMSGSEGTLGDVIFRKEIDTRTLRKSAGGRILNLAEFEDQLPDFKGIYHVMIRSTDDYWISDSRFISLSDIGLVAREGADKMYVFTNSIKTAESIGNVDIMIYAANNQLIGSGSTNKDGVAEIKYSKKDYSGFKPAMIIARTSEDFNYLPFNSTRVNTSRFEVGGKRNNPTGLDVFIYGERDIYRPGEKINYSVILRNREWQTPGEIPLKLIMLLPNGKELKTFRKTINEEGSLEGSIDIATSAITGSYTLEVYTSNDILLGSQNFMVEEFVPDRIRVNAVPDKKSLKVGEEVNVNISAMNFFGPPAADRKYEVEMQVRQKYFAPDKFSAFNFSSANRKNFTDQKVLEGTTDGNGNAIYSFTVPDTYADQGVLQATFYVTVFDETGRPVSQNSTIDIYTQDVFYGIRFDGYNYHPLNQPVKFTFAAVNKDGNAVNAQGEVHVIKHEYKTVLSRSGSYFRYESQKEEKLITEQTINVGANTSYSFVPRSPGDYEVRLYRPGSNLYISQTFYSYGGWGYAENSSFEVSREGNVDIELDKKSYFAGETVKALFKTPFSGRLLVTLESDKLISYHYLEVEKRTASLDLRMTGEHVPNIYLTATLIKPHEVSDIPLTVAHGYQNITVEEKSRKIPVSITAKKQVRSKTTQEVTVKATPGSYVTLAAVDNGVLQVSDYETPDPYGHFYQKRALQVTSYDLYPLLFPEVRARLSSTGGDGGPEMEKRVNPMQAKRVKIVSYWSGITKANGSGEAKFKFSIPQFSGEVRLMAVAYKGNNFGSSESTMTVADPLVISTALPRFLSPGDTINVPVTLTNTTTKSANANAQLKVKGPFKIIGSSTQSISINSKSEQRAQFALVADQTIGVGNISIEVNALGEKFSENIEISVRPASTLQKLTGSGTIAGGRSTSLSMQTSDFMPGSIDYRLVLSRSPVVELGSHLSYLVQYPYGCTEQTVSSAFPQVYFGDIVDAMGFNESLKVNANANILEAIRKIKMRQLYNGAVTLWDGGGYEDWWTTIYATHFLLEAKKAGFDIESDLLEAMLSYISTRLKSRETIEYYYNRNQNKRIAPKEVAYGLFVLAAAGKPDVSSMNYYKSNTELLALDSKYLLSAAFALAGDKRSFNSLLPSSFAGEESVPQTGGSYYSDVRDEAIALYVLIEVDPSNAQIGSMARDVSTKLRNREYLSTQERAFSFLALGKLLRKSNASDVTAEIKVKGKTVGTLKNGIWKGDMKTLRSTDVEVVTKGAGQLYYYWESEGISVSGRYKEEDSYLKVRRKFFDRTGREITGNTFKQNDLVIIGITIERSYSGTVSNVVLTDLLPAGFEIENPRTKEIPGMDWIKDGHTPTSLDVRDDRIHFFVDVHQPKQTYYYAVRVVSPGSFRMGPVSADAMYNGEYHSYHGARTIRVQ